MTEENKIAISPTTELKPAFSKSVKRPKLEILVSVGSPKEMIEESVLGLFKILNYFL